MDKEYLPVEGLAPFLKLTSSVIFGQDSEVIKQGRVAVCQSLSGTGALAILMAQEDVYMVTWLLTYLLCVLVGLGGVAPKVNLS